MTPRLAACLVVIGWLGCNGPAPPVDPWVGWDGGSEPVPPAAPAMPRLTPCRPGWSEVPAPGDDDVAVCEPGNDPAALPVLTPCSGGWREVAPEQEDGIALCEPWPESGEEPCEGDHSHFPGEPGCRLVGTPCPAGDWAPDLPSDREVLYVRASAPPGGTGTREDPFGTIAEAAAASRSGTVIALSTGTFDEAVSLRPRVTLWGACVAGTRVTCSTPSDSEATVTARGQDAAVRNLTLSGERPGALVFGWSLSLHLTDVVIDGGRGFGVGVGNGARAMLQDVVIRAPAPRMSDGQLGRGLQIESEAHVEVARGVIERCHEAGAYVTGTATALVLTDTVVRDTTAGPNPASGSAVIARQGAQVELERVALERNLWRALSAEGPGTTVSLTDTLVRSTSREDDGTTGHGLFIDGGATADVVRASIIGNRGAGLLASGEGTSLTLTDVVVRDTRPTDLDNLDQRLGRGLWAVEGAQVSLVRGLFERNEEFGVSASSPGTAVRLTDVVVRDTRSRDVDGVGGAGAGADSTALLEIERGVFERNHFAGLLSSLPGTTLAARDVVVRDTVRSPADLRGCGVIVQSGARLELEGAVFDGNESAGIFAVEADTTLDAVDVVVRDTISAEEGWFGRGITVEVGASATVNRALVERNRDIGIFVGEVGATASLADVVVRDTDLDATGAFGRGIEVVGDARLVVVRALIERNRDVGAAASRAGSFLDLTDVVVRDTRANARGEFGRGIIVQDGGQAELERVRLTSNREVSLFGATPDTTIRAVDLVVAETLERECADQGCADVTMGIGVGIYGGANIELRRFLISDNPLCGLQIAYGTDYEHEPFASGGTADLHEGEISRNLIGINVQNEELDIDRLMDAVVCQDNEVNLDMAALPVPDAMESL